MKNMKFIKIERVDKYYIGEGLRLEVSFSFSENLSSYFKSNLFFTEYKSDVKDIPDSILYIPIVANLLPIIWLMNIQLYVPTLDEEFYNCITNIKNGYQLMYPNLQLRGNVISKTEPNKVILKKSLVFFSGGVDAFASLIAHINEKPYLFSIFGADISLDDINSWDNAYGAIMNISSDLDLESIICKSNLRTFIHDDNLTDCLHVLGIDDCWWHAFQHSVGMIGLVSPLAYKYGIKYIYFGSSYTSSEKGKFTIASDPLIDEEIKFFGVNIIHDQYEYSRQEKLQHIIEYSKQSKYKPYLRVCWQCDTNGKNCGRCEKCLRTIYGIIAEHASPFEYGFFLSQKDFYLNSLRSFLRPPKDEATIVFWKDIQKRFMKEKACNYPFQTRWIYYVNYNKPVGLFRKVLRKIIKLIIPEF